MIDLMDDIKKESGVCPKCGSPLGEVTTTKSGKQLQRCSTGSWNPDTRSIEGCDYIKWITPEPIQLDEKCPKCGSPLLETVTRSGKKMKKCSTGTWDPKTKTAGGCDFVEWPKAQVEELDEVCPKCGEKLVMMTTSSGKRLKKCSTNSWDREKKMAIGCDFTEWQK